MTCLFIPEFKIGLWPSPKALKPSKQSMDSHLICPMEFAKNRQLKHQNITMRCQNPKESGTCGDERKHKKMKAKSANGALGLLESSIPVSLDVL